MTDDTLYYASGETKLGTLIVATGPNGIAAIVFGGNPFAAVRDLRATLPGRTLVADDERAGAALAAAIGLIEMPHAPFAAALDLDGTPIELATWAALRAIPAGETRSYGAIAQALPIAATAQEVGAACAANRLALAIPCHRVVKADGGISGYRWGVHRKRKLLALEAVA